MPLKTIIKLFIPPIVFSIRRRLLKRPSGQTPKPAPLSEKSVAYSYIIDLSRRVRLPMQNLEALSADYSFEQIRSISAEDIEPNFYGSFWTMARYARISPMNLSPRNFSIQHGIVFLLDQWERNKSGHVNFVWSRQIASMFREELEAKETYAVGAPFLYAAPILSEVQIAREKKRLGRNLLAFPMHSTHFMDKNYNPAPFINILKEQRKRFDTVRVCLYWRDIQRGVARPYQQAGFECVCCGHMFDQFFLQRQCALLEIADATISNAVGSHVGYSISLGKPHWLIPDEYELTDNNDKTQQADQEMEKNRKSEDMKKLQDAFSCNPGFVITDTQERLVDKYWGISDKKSPKQMRTLIASLYKRNGGG